MEQKGWEPLFNCVLSKYGTYALIGQMESLDWEYDWLKHLPNISQLLHILF